MSKERCMWFGYGILFGAVAGLLLAPKSGARTRVLIAARARDGQRLIKKRTAEVRDNVADTIQRGTDAAKRVREGLAAAVEVGKKTMMR